MPSSKFCSAPPETSEARWNTTPTSGVTSERANVG